MAKRIKTGGRQKGSPNKVTAQLKDMILGALQEAGGQQYLLQCAHDPATKRAFLALLGRVLPLQVHGAGEHGEHMFQKIVVEIVKPGVS